MITTIVIVMIAAAGMMMCYAMVQQKERIDVLEKTLETHVAESVTMEEADVLMRYHADEIKKALEDAAKTVFRD